MKVYVFGNEDVKQDNRALKAAKKLEKKFKNLEFVAVKPNEDLPFAENESVLLMDVVDGLDEVRVLEEEELERLVLPPRTTAHDFDLGFQLKYLRKIGKLGEIRVIGLPASEDIDYDSIQSILRKFVAHDMQGS